MKKFLKSLIMITCMYITVSTLYAGQKNITATWDSYTTSENAPATALELFMTQQPPSIDTAIASDIPTDSTQWLFQVEFVPGDTLWFAMQAINIDHEPILMSDLTAWVPLIYEVVAPATPSGLSVTITTRIPAAPIKPKRNTKK